MRLALWDEQGVGDRLLAANLLRNLKGRDMEIVLECHPRLEAIYKRSFPWIDHVFPTSKEDHISWPLEYPPTHKCAVMSLAKWFWKAGEFDRTPYLVPNPELTQKYRKEFEALGKPPYYALSWKGGALKTNTKYRSLKLGWFKDAIKELGGTWISVQYHDDAKEDVQRFRDDSSLPIFHCDGAQAFDYDHTLSILAAVDHTITACNSVVHTAGGAGLPCTVLVPRRRAWRYPKQEFFPWYGDHIRMVHQTFDEDWETPIKAAVERVRGLS